QLQTDRQAMPIDVGETTRHADSANTGEIRGAGEDIREIHLQGIVRAFAQFESWDRRSRRNQRVDFLERLCKILPDQLAHLLRAQIISIVITGAQNVSAENDPAFYFRAETFLSRAAVMIEEIPWMFGPMSVADAIKAGEIRRSLRRCQNVIDCNGVIGVRQRNVDNLCA